MNHQDYDTLTTHHTDTHHTDSHHTDSHHADEGHHMSPQLRDYLAACNHLSIEAGLFAVSCMGTGAPELTRCTQLAMDAQAVAQLAIASVARCSPTNDVIALACARVCDTTADECERWKNHHEPAHALLKAARHCAHECRRMANV